MSEYSMTFAKKLVEDETFDTIFGAEEDDRLIDCILKEDDEFIKDERDTDKIEDGTGAIGKGDGLGSDIGEDHETKGADAPKEDTSDQDIIGKEGGETFKKGGQLNAGDNAQGTDMKDGSTVSGDLHVAGDSADETDKAFEEAFNALMEEADNDIKAADELEDAKPSDHSEKSVKEGIDCVGPNCPNAQPPVAPAAAPVPVATPPVADPAPSYNDSVVGDDTDSSDNLIDALDSDEDYDDTDSDYEDQVEDIVQDCGQNCAPTAAPHEDADVSEADNRDADKVEDGTGAIGKGDGLGSDIGPGHDENKPSDDTSDEDIIAAAGGETLDKGDQLNAGDNAQGKVEDGGEVCVKTPDCARVAGDDSKSADDSFKEASKLDNIEDSEDIDDEIIDSVDKTDDGEASEELVNDLNSDDDDDLMDLV